MENYVRRIMRQNEKLVKQANRNKLFLLGAWIKGILFFWLLLIPTIKAIIKTVRFNNTELAITDKRIVGKTGVLNTDSLDAPLNKIQNVSVDQPFWGKIFNYGTVCISTASGIFEFGAIKNADEFKNTILDQIEKYEEARIKQQAMEMAQAMSTAMRAKPIRKI